MINKQCPYPRGRGIGGSTLINYLLYARGNRKDFDRWADLGNRGWAYADVLPYFKKSEHFPQGDPMYHGHNGPMNVEFHRPNNLQYKAFIEANQEIGMRVLDYNGRNQLGVSPAQLNDIEGFRDDTGKAFLKPVINRENLTVMTENYVIKILIDNKTKSAYGVHFMHKGRKYVVHADKEIILSAGSIGSPSILLWSGIGPADHLQEVNIPVYQNLPVGKHLIDHPTFYGISMEMNYTEPSQSIEDYVRGLLNASGPYTLAGNSQGLGFYQTKYQNISGVPDIEFTFIVSNSTDPITQRVYHFTNETYEGLWGHLSPTRLCRINIVLLHPISRGSIRLRSSDPFEYPLIDLNLLSDPDDFDIARIYEGIQIAMGLFDTESFKRLNVTLRPPRLPACESYEDRSQDFWYCCIRQVTMHLYHAMGTNRMGTNPGNSVVDSNLRVHGINNLRVADTSIFPDSISGHTAAATMMVGEKVSDLIKGFTS